MAIFFKNNRFTLETKDHRYEFSIDKYGVLNHEFYGAKSEKVVPVEYKPLGMCGNIYDAGYDRAYSLDFKPLEYSTWGIGDFRVNSLLVLRNKEEYGLDLRYKDHRIYDGKYDIPGLPSSFGEDSKTLEITLKDTCIDFYVILKYAVFPEENVITRAVCLKNEDNSLITVEKVFSLCLDLPKNDWDIMHFYGRHNMERVVERIPVPKSIFEISSKRGASSHQHNPSFIICRSDCTEETGFCIGATFCYSGNFKAQIETDQLDNVRTAMGINDEHFSWDLKKGEEFLAPEVIITCSNTGLNDLSSQFHKFIKCNISRSEFTFRSRPVLVNSWESFYFDFNGEKLLNLADNAAKLGIDLLVLDDGWFGNRIDDNRGLGDWYPNEERLGGSLASLISEINAKGLKFGIWVEPEMVSEDSDLYRLHPDWAITVEGRPPIRSRHQLVLDLSKPEVVTYLYESLSKLLRENNIEYVKWDMNRSLCDYSSKAQSHKYMLGLYGLLERLTREFPKILFEGCSSGGGRFDTGMLYYHPQIWCSDNTDCYDRALIQYGTSFIYPPSTMACHVSTVPNHITGRDSTMEDRGIVASQGILGYELDLSILSSKEKEQVQNQIVEYKELEDLIINGNFRRLSNPYMEGKAVWQYISRDETETITKEIDLKGKNNPSF